MNFLFLSVDDLKIGWKRFQGGEEGMTQTAF